MLCALRTPRLLSHGNAVLWRNLGVQHQYKYRSIRSDILPIASTTNPTHLSYRSFSSSSPMSQVQEIKSLEQFKTIIGGDKPVVIDFWATWCGPCKVISPIFVKFSEKFGNVGFYKVDIDDQSEIAAEVGIRAMPTFIAFKNGEKLDELVGAAPAQLETLIAKFN